MKNLFSKFMVFAAGLLFAVVAFAQVYPYSNPSYTPMAVLPPVTLSAPGAVVFNNNGSATIGITIQGTCTSLTAVPQVSNDGTNYITENMYPLTVVTTAGAVLTTSAAGAWHANIQGWRFFRMNVTALTAACTIGMAADDLTLQLF